MTNPLELANQNFQTRVPESGCQILKFVRLIIAIGSGLTSSIRLIKNQMECLWAEARRRFFADSYSFMGRVIGSGVTKETETLESNLTKRIEVNELSHLLDEYSSSLALYASQWSRSPDDCVQEAFVALAVLNHRPENVKAWLYKVVRNQALNDSRSQQRRKTREHASAKSFIDTVDPLKRMVASDEQKRLLSALDGVSEDQRELIVLRIWSSMKWSEIAELTGMSSSTAQRNYVVALEAMKQKLESKCLTKQK